MDTATLYNRIKNVAERYGVPVIGPNLSMGSTPGDSIVAMDSYGLCRAAFCNVPQGTRW